MKEELEYQSGPDEVEVDSPFGKFWIKVMYWGVIADANSNGRSVVINGVSYSLVLRLQYGDADRLELEVQKGDPYGFHAIYGVRLDWDIKGISYNDSGISSAARGKVKSVVIPLVQAWLDKNPALVSEARYANASNEYKGAVEAKEKADAAAVDAAVALELAWAKRADAQNELGGIQRASAWRE